MTRRSWRRREARGARRGRGPAPGGAAGGGGAAGTGSRGRGPRPRHREDERQHAHQGRDAEGEERSPPAEGGELDREHGDDEELAHPHAGDGDAVRHPHPVRIPAAEEHPHRGDRGARASEREHHAVEHERLPRLLDEPHRDEAEGRHEHRRPQHDARAVAIHEPPDHGEGARGEHHEHGHAERERAAAPGEVVRHRVQEEPDREARTAVEEQHEEADREQEAGGRGVIHEPSLPARPPAGRTSAEGAVVTGRIPARITANCAIRTQSDRACWMPCADRAGALGSMRGYGIVDRDPGPRESGPLHGGAGR